MPILNQHWYNRNEGNAYPVDEAVSSVDDNGTRLPSTILADLNLRWPEELGKYAFISAVSVTRGMVTIAIQASHDPLSVIDCVPLGIVSVPRPITRYKNYAIQAQAPGVGGWVAFGSGADDAIPYTGRFSTPAQGRLAPRAARAYRSLPVASLSAQNVLPALTGTVRLAGAKPLEVVKESREIRGVNRDAIVIRLVQPDQTGGQTNDTQVEQSIFHQYAGPCSGRPESHTCGDPQPIEFINSVGPDCDGVIHIVFTGCADISHISEPCGVLVDCNLGQAEACVNAYIPFPGGSLPGEYTPSASSVPSPPPVSESGLSISDVFLGGLPWTDCFLGSMAANFEVKSGLWLFDIGYDPHRPCLASASSTSSTSSISSLSCFDVSVSGSASVSENPGPCDCCVVWDQTLVDVVISGVAPPNDAINGTYTLAPLQNNPCQWGAGGFTIGTTNLFLNGIQLDYLHPVNNTMLPNVYLWFFGGSQGGVGTLAVYGADTMVCPGTTITKNTGLALAGGFTNDIPITTRVIGGCPGGGSDNLGRIRQKFATSRNNAAANYCTEWNEASWPVATKPGSTLVAIVLPQSLFIPVTPPSGKPWVFRTQIGSGNHYFSVYTWENAPSQTGPLNFITGQLDCFCQGIFFELENLLLTNIIDIQVIDNNQSGLPYINVLNGTGLTTHHPDEICLAIYSIKSPSSAIGSFTNGFTEEIVSDALNNMSILVASRKTDLALVDVTTQATGANPSLNLDGGGGLISFRAITGTAPGHGHGHIVKHCEPYHHHGTSKHVGPLIDPLYTASSAAARNITVWDGFDDYTVHRRVVTDLQIHQGPVGALHNAGIVINYQVNPNNNTQVIYYLVEIDADSQQIMVRRWTGTNFVPLVSVFVPGIIVGNWYRLTVDTNSNHIGPTITVHLEGYDNALNVTLGPVQASNWGTPNGRFGLYSDRSVTSYSFWHVEEL